MRIIGIGEALSLALLAITGFPVLFVSGDALSGYPLIVHFSAAPIFAVCLSLSVVMRAYGNRFTKGDLPFLSNPFVKKLSFWMVCTLGAVIVLSMALCLSSWFGPDGQSFLIRIHAWAALLFLPVYCVQFYSNFLAKGQS